MQILFIGGSGFVGQHASKHFLDKGHSVTLLNRGNRTIPGCKQLLADRNSPEQFTEALKKIKKFDAIIDTSAYTKGQTEIALAAASDKTNHWIHLSSAAVYDQKNHTSRPNESSPIGGAATWGEYGVNKSEIDQLLRATEIPCPITIIRPPYLYGPGNAFDRETFIWKRALREKPILIPGDGNTTIQFLHVSDLAVAFEKIASAKPPEKYEIYNIGAESLTLSDWVNKTLAAAELDTNKYRVQNSSYGARDHFPFRDYPCILDTKKIETNHRWFPKVQLKEGLHQTYAGYSKKALQKTKIDTRIEDCIIESELLKPN